MQQDRDVETPEMEQLELIWVREHPHKVRRLALILRDLEQMRVAVA